MTFREFLIEFRTESGQLQLLNKQLQARPQPTGRDTELSPQQRRLQTRRRRETLAQLKEASMSRWDVMNERFERVLQCSCATARQRTILRQYYGAAMTDSQIGALLGRTPKSITDGRLRWLRRVEEDGHE